MAAAEPWHPASTAVPLRDAAPAQEQAAEPVPLLETTPLDAADGLVVRMFHAQCLAASSYVVGHDGWAVVVDPMRDIDAYLAALTEHRLTLRCVLLTHAFADYVGGHQALADRTGAVVVGGRHAGFRFPHFLHAQTGDCFSLSDRYVVRVMETPGRTRGCVTYVLDKRAPDSGVGQYRHAESLVAFTGSTLFVGSCGRPDPARADGCNPDGSPTADSSGDALERELFRSLGRLSALGDDTLVLPSHGAGYAAGVGLGSKLYSTIGHERRSNPALQHGDEAAFAQWLLASLPTAPQYFAGCIERNRSGPRSLGPVLAAVPRVSGAELARAAELSGGLIIDTREPEDHYPSHLPGSLNFPLGEFHGTVLSPVDGNFEIWLGTLVTSPDLYLVVRPGGAQEALERCGRVGYASRVRGVASDLAGCATRSQERLRHAPDAGAAILNHILDVRSALEFHGPKGHLAGAQLLPLQGTMEDFLDRARGLDPRERYVCVCRGGFRSAVAASLLRRAGLWASDVWGGYSLTVAPAAADRMTTEPVQLHGHGVKYVP